MEILLNGEKKVLTKEKTVLQLLEGLDLNPAAVTVNLNEQVVSKEDLGALKLKNGDEVEVLIFMGGGF